MRACAPTAAWSQPAHIPAGPVQIEGVLTLPSPARGVVLFAHGSGSSRHSPRNGHVARVLQANGLGTLLLDLLTPAEDQLRENRFDIPLLAQRLRAAVRWLQQQNTTQGLPLGLFGASTGAAAALAAAAALGPAVGAVVSRGGRPDLASAHDLARVSCPTLLLVGGRDEEVLALNRQAARRLQAPTTLSVVPGATHLFEEPGALEAVAQAAADWFVQHLHPPTA